MTHRPSVAVIGSGIAGLGAAWLLKDACDVFLFEKNQTLGGHSNTVEVDYDGVRIPVDTGFIVFNHATYPHLKALFAHIGVQTQPGNMSFGVSIDEGWLEYASHNVRSVFTTPKEALNIAFIRMLLQILRFNRSALRYREQAEEMTLGELLDAMKLGDWFRRYYLLPMAGAIWSCSFATMLEYPAAAFLRFFDSHGLLSVNAHPQWYTVTGGSREYVKRIAADLGERVYTNTPIASVRSDGKQVLVTDAVAGREQSFDHVIIATHGDQAQEMLADITPEESRLLSAFDYQRNRAVLHRDVSLMPKNHRAWASWNYLTHRGASDSADLTVTYWMNSLQQIDHAKPLFITLNPTREPAQGTVFGEFRYEHPIFNRSTVAAQRDMPSIQGKRGIWFAGAHLRYGFHEDGLMSAVDIANALGVKAPWQ